MPDYEVTHSLGLRFTATRLRRPHWLWRLLRRLPYVRRWAYVTQPFNGATAYGIDLGGGVSEVTRIEIIPPMDADEYTEIRGKFWS